jgi:hypothetical protein
MCLNKKKFKDQIGITQKGHMKSHGYDAKNSNSKYLNVGFERNKIIKKDNIVKSTKEACI